MAEARRLHPAVPLAALALVTVAGLFYVKWFPYWNRAFVAAAEHSIGGSILMGDAARAPDPSWEAALGYALAYGKAIWKAMVLGLLLGSGVQALLPADGLRRLLGGRGLGGAVMGGVLAIPGMMCTCCAAPVVAGLRRRQAAPGAAVAFWLGNTMLNPATLVFMGFVLGWGWSALRLGVGALMVFGLGYLANRMTTQAEAARAEDAIAALAAEPREAPFRRWLTVLAGMTVRLVPEYIVLVLLLGAGRAWLFPAIGPEIGDHLVWIVAFAVAGMLFVIPTAGEVPVVHAMLLLGVGAGPAGALLMTLPPISVPSVAMLARAFPPRILAMVAAGVVVLGVAGGGLAILLGL